MSKTKAKDKGRYGLSRYLLLTVVLSFLGWCFETGYLWLRTGNVYDSGFMTLPFCPIYACALMGTYFLMGTPHEPKGILKGVAPAPLRYALYFALAFFIPSVLEYLVGLFFDTAFSMRLWDYTGAPYTLNGYVCLPVSLAWAGLIFAFMRLGFLPIKNLVGKIPKPLAVGLCVVFAVVFAVDIGANVVKRL